MTPARALAATILGLILSGCGRSEVKEPEAHQATAPSTVASAPPPPPVSPARLSSRISRAAPERLVAIGDLHGDLDHARRALRLAGAIDARDQWIGGHLTVVQTGDEIDRGDDDRSILDHFEEWKKEAAAAGGEVIAMLGNHEIMNASLDFRYVTAGGFDAFSSPTGGPDTSVGGGPGSQKGRAAAFTPGGVYATLEASRPVVMKVGDTVFAHGGILPKHVAYGLDRMNDELDDWLAGKRRDPPAIVVSEDGPIWTRAYSAEAEAPACAPLADTLKALGAKRMVVGHTVQRSGANSACGGAVWRIDVGLSRYFGGPIEVLEIRGDDAKVLRER
jgi:hypothetical protein